MLLHVLPLSKHVTVDRLRLWFDSFSFQLLLSFLYFCMNTSDMYATSAQMMHSVMSHNKYPNFHQILPVNKFIKRGKNLKFIALKFPSRESSGQWKFPYNASKPPSDVASFQTYILYYPLPLCDSKRLLESRSPGRNLKSTISYDQNKVELTGSY